ncbi:MULTISPECIES: DUF4296 domain-containing protein [Flavobacteriaceae]|uniref:DUF4296 domain-containing protein n=2 Tax=Flavobacteriaceae TaxID=49546 RepID=A0A4Y8ASZ4_9FLAO|nr:MULTISPECIES: DUF4296 domain-containing protein [Flavobacteriaceae]TEW73792.1 DUF4296 domain-containing protein [Gramella jeungdoensis]GGK37598.1 hypothetical protein GCM10007963_02160 [Lutibacter litoralis]
MNKYLYILFISFFMFSCTSNTILKKPDNLIPEDQMVDLLTDLLLAVNAETTKNLDLKRKVDYHPLVFKKYNIDSTQFKESNFYYTSRVDDYDVILSKVEERLKTLNKKFETLKREEDSIAQAIKNLEKKSIDSINKIKRRRVEPIKENLKRK